MKILAISQVYFPDTVATAQHLTDLLEALAQKGHSVTVLTSMRNYEDSTLSYIKREKHNSVSIRRIRNTGYGKKNILTRLIDFFSFNLLLSFKLLFLNKHKYDLIIGMTSPPLVSYIGLKIAKIKKLKFLYWAMDLQPELSIVANYIKSGSKSARALQIMGDYIFKYADKIIILDTYMLKHINSRLGFERKGIDIIPVWPVMSKVYNGLRLENPFRINNGFGNKIIIMYSGNHSVMHPLTTLLEAAVILKDDDRFLFVHIGSGVRLKEVLQYKTDFLLKNILVLPYQPRELIHLSLGSADIHVVSLGNESVGYTHPNKIYGAMFIGKPILYIGPQKSHITDILDRCKGNISLQHGKTDELVEELLNFEKLGEDKINLIGLNNKRFAEKHFHPSTLISNMIHSVEST